MRGIIIKTAAVSVMVGNRSRELVLDELEKCELVCANCHVMRTVVRARRTISEEIGVYRFEVLTLRDLSG